MSDFVCRTCGEMFAVPVWHCPRCSAHNHAGDVERRCGYCYAAARHGQTPKAAEKHFDRLVENFKQRRS